MGVNSWLMLVAEGWLISALIMFVLWLFYLYMNEPSVVDIGWGGSIGCVAWWMYWSVPELGLRQIVVLIAASCWSVRLSSLLISRMLKGQRDRRYIELSESWKENLARNYLVFFQAQALSVALLTVPFALALLAPDSAWSAWDTAGALVFVVGFLGESIADQQMVRFRADPHKKKDVCDRGLWRYSRYPNYFFEWLIWISYSLLAMNHSAGLVGWISPSVILVSIVKITGIPPTEERLLASKGDVYREYQRTTSAFIPMPPRRKR